jgi:hypothetical protein
MNNIIIIECFIISIKSSIWSAYKNQLQSEHYLESIAKLQEAPKSTKQLILLDVNLIKQDFCAVGGWSGTEGVTVGGACEVGSQWVVYSGWRKLR